MSTVQSIFPMVSVRNPWGYLIQKGFKKIENRKKQLSKDFHNIWIALHVAKTFKTQEEKYAQKYLKNHPQLLTQSTPSKQKIQTSLNSFFNKTSFKLNSTQKISQLIHSELKPQLGHIIAFIKISKCVNSQIGKSYDSLYCDQPYVANSHWVISDVIPLTSNEYCSTRGYPGCSRINDTLLNKLLSNILTKKLQQRNEKKEANVSENKEPENDKSQSGNIEEDDDDMLNILDGLDNGTQMSQVREDTIDSVSSEQFISPKSKKRKRIEIVQSDEDNDSIECDYSPAPKKTKINGSPKINKLKITSVENETNGRRNLPAFVTGKSGNNNERFNKFSKNNSFYNMKRGENKIDLMITPQVNNNSRMNDNESDIDAELDMMLAKTRQKSEEKLQQNDNKIKHKILLNPNEMRRKAHLCLPDEYNHRIIVFDTETACFKPEGVIIDIGAVELINGKLTGRKFQSYIKPWAKIHEMAMKVHGITERFLDMYADGDIYEIMQSFMEWINSDCICSRCRNLDSDRKHKMKLVGHNVVFDVRHLNGAINYCQSKCEKKIWNTVNIESTFDTQIYFRNVLGNVGNYSLDFMCQKFGVRTDERKHLHGALVDAMCTAKCLQEMWKRDKDVKDRKCKNRFFTKKL